MFPSLPLCLVAAQVFYQDTSNAVMGALLLNDICNPASPAQPSSKVRLASL